MKNRDAMPPKGEPQLRQTVVDAYNNSCRPLSALIGDEELYYDWTQDENYQCMVEAAIASVWYPDDTLGDRLSRRSPRRGKVKR